MSADERRIELWKLIPLRRILKHLGSFIECVENCNFKFRAGVLNGKLYAEADGHNVAEYDPRLRADYALYIYHIELTDTVTLTPRQYTDFKAIRDELTDGPDEE